MTSSEFEGGSSKQEHMLNFERLLVYQKAVDLTNDIYTLTQDWSKPDTWNLKDQFRRAVLSVALNIAEGSGRTKRDFRNFLRNSRSSCYECLAILELSRRQGYLSQAHYTIYRARCIELTKMISGLINSLRNGEKNAGSSNFEPRTSNKQEVRHG